MRASIEKFRKNATNANMAAVVEGVRNNVVQDDDVALLAEVLGTSGRVLAMPSELRCVDLASTGGPTSLSTLLGPLYLRAMGWVVPKLGVQGRPAGGIDTLSRIPGYKTILVYKEIVTCLDKCGYCHFLANREYAPLDRQLFHFRQESNGQNLPELVVASILAKKVAVGLNRAGLEIRVAPHGNFGSTIEMARVYAGLFMRVADILGIKSVCILTDARDPYQPYVGRGESLLALKKIFDGEASGTLLSHATGCLAMAHATVGNPPVDTTNISEQIERHFFENIVAQGGSRDAFEQYVDDIESGHKHFVYGKRAGFLSINLEQLRNVILRFQKVMVDDSISFPDGMGIILRKNTGDLVARGDILASVRVSAQAWPNVREAIEDSFCVEQEYRQREDFEVLSGE